MAEDKAATKPSATQPEAESKDIGNMTQAKKAAAVRTPIGAFKSRDDMAMDFFRSGQNVFLAKEATVDSDNKAEKGNAPAVASLSGIRLGNFSTVNNRFLFNAGGSGLDTDSQVTGTQKKAGEDDAKRYDAQVAAVAEVMHSSIERLKNVPAVQERFKLLRDAQVAFDKIPMHKLNLLTSNGPDEQRQLLSNVILGDLKFQPGYDRLIDEAKQKIKEKTGHDISEETIMYALTDNVSDKLRPLAILAASKTAVPVRDGLLNNPNVEAKAILAEQAQQVVDMQMSGFRTSDESSVGYVRDHLAEWHSGDKPFAQVQAAAKASQDELKTAILDAIKKFTPEQKAALVRDTGLPEEKIPGVIYDLAKDGIREKAQATIDGGLKEAIERIQNNPAFKEARAQEQENMSSAQRGTWMLAIADKTAAQITAILKKQKELASAAGSDELKQGGAVAEAAKYHINDLMIDPTVQSKATIVEKAERAVALQTKRMDTAEALYAGNPAYVAAGVENIKTLTDLNDNVQTARQELKAAVLYKLNLNDESGLIKLPDISGIAKKDIPAAIFEAAENQIGQQAKKAVDRESVGVSSYGGLLDTDIASESTAYPTAQVKLQAGVSAMAQAHQLNKKLLDIIDGRPAEQTALLAAMEPVIKALGKEARTEGNSLKAAFDESKEASMLLNEDPHHAIDAAQAYEAEIMKHINDNKEHRERLEQALKGTNIDPSGFQLQRLLTDAVSQEVGRLSASTQGVDASTNVQHHSSLYGARTANVSGLAVQTERLVPYGFGHSMISLSGSGLDSPQTDVNSNAPATSSAPAITFHDQAAEVDANGAAQPTGRDLGGFASPPATQPASRPAATRPRR